MTKTYLPDGSYAFPCVRADYVPHKLTRYAENKLISALRFPDKRKALKVALTNLPAFDAAERMHDRPMRRLQVKQLGRLFVGSDRVAELAENVHGNILEGYVGREPHTAAANNRLRELYEAQKTSQFCALGASRNTAQFTNALMGTPGVGKSAALARIAQLYPPVIHHPELDLWQIPVLIIEMAYNGLSQASLAHAIIRAIAERFPPGDYERLYLKPRSNAEQLLLAAFALMHVHAVGAIFVDEAQNRDYNAQTDADGDEIRGLRTFKVSQTPLITLLITASNRMQVPLLMCGTAELRDVMGKRLSKVRRMVGEGMRPWGPLSIVPTGSSTYSDFDIFMNVLWPFNWLQDPPAYTPEMRSLFHYYTLGIPDFIIKLFKAVQWRALEDGRETFDAELVHQVANAELAAVSRITRKMHKAETDLAARAHLSLIADVAAEFGLSPLAENFQKKEATLEDAVREAAQPPRDYASTFTRKAKASTKKKPTDKRSFEPPPVADWQQIGE